MEKGRSYKSYTAFSAAEADDWEEDWWGEENPVAYLANPAHESESEGETSVHDGAEAEV